jgi:pilus assembly protein CpaF
MFLRNKLSHEGTDPLQTIEQSLVQASSKGDPYREIKVNTHRRLIELMGQGVPSEEMSAEEIQALICQALEEVLSDAPRLLSRTDRERLLEEIDHDVRGFGVLEPLLKDDDISEIMVNNPHQIYIERRGKIELSSVRFYDDRHLLQIIDKIVSQVGRRIDESSPMCDARLPDGSRVNAIIPPLAIDGPVLTIRKFRKEPLKVQDLIEFGTLSSPMADFLKGCVEAKLNVLISGGTGSGKTTLLNVLSSYIPGDERLITIEDAAEMRLQQEHVIRLETRHSNAEGIGAISQLELLRNSLRMRPDRIILGEVRGIEALAMLQAMNTGHEGSLATIHANTTRDALARLETMVLLAESSLPLRAIREQMQSALDLIVQIERSRDGHRRVKSITEIVGIEGDAIQMQELYVFQQDGIDSQGMVNGAHRSTGIRPRCAEKLALAGIPLPPQMLRKDSL